MLKTRRRPLQGVAVAGAMLCVALPAAAHPHMCVSVEATVLYEKGGFTGLKQKWTFFDERYTAMAVEGLDKNNDGKLDRAELEELAKVNIDGLKENGYFTFPSVAGAPVKLDEPKDYWLEYTGGALSLHFTLPFATAVQAQDKALELALQDRENYISFGLAKAPNAIRLGDGAPKRCRVAVDPVVGEEQVTLKLILEALGCAVTVPKAISVACEGP